MEAAEKSTLAVGMLWYDADVSAPLATRLERAARYYREKYGAQPTLCVVHPDTAGEDPPPDAGGVRIEASRSVLPEHLWLGVAVGGEAEPTAG